MVAGVSAELDTAERARAIRALLRSPLLDRMNGAFGIIVSHESWLRTWFHDTCEWSLVVDHRRGFARLHKTPDPGSLARPPLRALRAGKKPFDRRRYILFCVTVMALGRFPRGQVSLQDLSSRIVDITSNEEGLDEYAASDKTERVALVDVLDLLSSFGVLTTVDQRDDYERDENANALYTIDDRRLAQLFLRRDLETERSERHSVMRRLLDDPVVHRDELNGEKREFLNSSTGWVQRRLADAGLLLEHRAGGWCAVDPTAESTDMRFPQPNTIAHQVALLAISDLGKSPEHTSDWIPRTQLRQMLADLMDEHAHWAKGYRDEGGLDKLIDEVLGVLNSFGLIRADALGCEFRPAAGRFRHVVVTTSKERP